MPVSLLGLMAVAMFYVITVVVGLCANRCLAKEEEDDDVEHPDMGPPTAIKRDYSAEFELLHLLESTAGTTTTTTTTGGRAKNVSATTLTTPLAETVIDQHRASSSSVDRSGIGNNVTYRRSPLIDHHDSSPNIPGAAVGRSGSSGTPPSTIVRSINHAPTAVKKILRKPRPPVGTKYLLAERNIGYILGSMSLIAIRTGGAYAASISEQVYLNGLLWCQMPIAGCLSLIVGACLFADQAYTENFVTLIDPFQNVYGVRAGVILMIPVLIADILYATVVLSFLGALMQTMLGFDYRISVTFSLVSVLTYLLIGGYYAGTFTDALQLVYLLFGLWLITPFAVTRTRPSLTEKVTSWVGQIQDRRAGLYIDQMAALILGGIPMQSYFQRVVSCKSAKNIRILTISGSVGCILNAVPAVLIGAAAKSADWSNTTVGSAPTVDNGTIVLPLLLSEYVPGFVQFLVLGMLASGLMASCDSTIFGSASMLTQNFYRNWLKPLATECEIRWVARISIVVVGVVVLLLCLVFPSWHQHWLLPYDLLYVLVFPQVFAVVHYRYANTYGAMFALAVGATCRLLFGEARIRLPAALKLPFWDTEHGQLFPYRTFAMLISLLMLLFVSLIYHYLYHKGRLSSVNDIFLCFAQETTKKRKRVTLESVERMTVL